MLSVSGLIDVLPLLLPVTHILGSTAYSTKRQKQSDRTIWSNVPVFSQVRGAAPANG